jgi:hypothetical protein
MAAEPQSTEEEAPGTPPPAFKRTDLQRSPSPVSGWEIRQTLVEIPEGIESGRHSHPGPEVGYIVRGVVSMEFDDGTALALRTGDPSSSRLGSSTTPAMSVPSPRRCSQPTSSTKPNLSSLCTDRSPAALPCTWLASRPNADSSRHNPQLRTDIR